jgi:hypothetical protein
VNEPLLAYLNDSSLKMAIRTFDVVAPLKGVVEAREDVAQNDGRWYENW